MATLDLTKYGITGTTEIIYNPSYEQLFKDEMDPSLEGFDKGQLTELGAVNVMTGIYTGRSPKDKFIVMDENSKDTVWWTTPEYPNDNHVATEETWAVCKDLAINELSNKKLYVVDCFCGANADTRMGVRFIMEVAWQAHFVENMFIKPTAEELETFEPDFVSYVASKAKVENYKELGLNSETAVVFNVTSREQVILNTWYGGEMKKGLFSMMNYYLPLKGIASILSAAAFMEAVLAEGEGDLLYLYTMSMSFGIFTVAASCIAVLPTVRELSSYKGSIMKYNLLRSGTSRYIVGKAISISIIGGLALMLGPAISLIVLSFKNPLVSEAFLDIYALEPELNASFSNLVRAQQYQLFLAIKLLMVFMYGFSINMIAFAVSTCAKESFVIALAPFLILQSATNLLNSAGTAYVKPATYLHGYLLRVPFDNTLGFFGVILLTHVVIFGICLTASIYIIGRRLKYA